jgi:DNA-binding CsgD family transcriptional regulator
MGWMDKKTTTIVFSSLGFAFFWPAHRFTSYYPLASRDGNGWDASLVFQSYAIMLTIEALILALLIVTWRQVEASVLNADAVPVIAGLSGIVGTVLVFASSRSDFLALMELGLGLFFLALYLGIMTLQWGHFFAGRDRKEAVVAISLAGLVSSVITAFCYSSGPDLQPLVIIVGAVLTLVFWELAKRNANGCGKAEGRNPIALRKLPFKIIALSLALLIIVSVLTRFLSSPGIGNVPLSERLLTQYLLILIFCATTMVFYINSFSKRIMNLLFLFIIVMMMASLLMIIIFSASHGQVIFAVGTTKAVCRVLELFIFLIIIWSVNENRLSRIQCIGLYALFVLVVPYFFSNAIATPLNLFMDFRESSYVVPVTATISFVISASVFIVLNARRQNFVQDNAYDKDRNRSAVLLCRTLADQHNLTSRELDVMSFIYQGFSVKKISEVLIIATSTTQGYSRSIYRKLGVHSRQQLIDMVNKASGS